jgi:hypothetical protein
VIVDGDLHAVEDVLRLRGIDNKEVVLLLLVVLVLVLVLVLVAVPVLVLLLVVLVGLVFLLLVGFLHQEVVILI